MANTRQFAKRQRHWFKSDEIYELLPFLAKNNTTFQPKDLLPLSIFYQYIYN